MSENVFTTDPAAKGYWNFEYDAFLIDGINSQTLVNTNGATQSLVSKVGNRSAEFDSTFAQYLSVDDSSLVSGFPFKYGEDNKIVTVCGWYRPTVLGVNDIIFGKWFGGANKRSFMVYTNGIEIRIGIGYNGGVGTETKGHESALTLNEWYFVCIALNGITKEFRIHILDGDLAQLGDDENGFFSNEPSITSAEWSIGGNLDGECCDGLIDGVVIFNRYLDTADMDTIADEMYGQLFVAGGWEKQITVVPDPTQIDTDLDDYPLAIHINDSCGTSNYDGSEFFDKLNAPWNTIAEISDDLDGSDGDKPTEDLWNMSDPDNIYFDGGKLEMAASSSTATGPRIESKYLLKGDFDVQVSFDLLTYPDTNSWRCGIWARCAQGRHYTDAAIMGLIYSGGRRYEFNKVFNGSWSTTGSSGSSDTSGKLRITRAGSVLKGYRWSGSAWSQVGTFTDANFENTDMEIWVRNGLWDNKPTTKFKFYDLVVNSAGSIGWVLNNHPGSARLALVAKMNNIKQELYGEIGYWNGDSSKAVIHTRVPKMLAISGMKIDIYIRPTGERNDYYIGRRGETPCKRVWNDYYLRVFHYSWVVNGNNEYATQEVLFDSSKYNITGDLHMRNNPWEECDEGEMGYYIYLQDSGYGAIANSSELEIKQAMSVECLMYTMIDNSGGGTDLYSWASKGGPDGTDLPSWDFNSYGDGVDGVKNWKFGLLKQTSDEMIYAGVDDFDWTYHSWQTYVGTYDRVAGELKAYRDGVQMGSTVEHNEEMRISGEQIRISGIWYDGVWQGTDTWYYADEWRLSKVAHSPEWVKVDNSAWRDTLNKLSNPVNLSIQMSSNGLGFESVFNYLIKVADLKYVSSLRNRVKEIQAPEGLIASMGLESIKAVPVPFGLQEKQDIYLKIGAMRYIQDISAIITDPARGIETIGNPLGMMDVQAFLIKLGLNEIQNLRMGGGLESIQTIKNQISEGKAAIQELKNVISGDSYQAIQAILNTLEETTYINSLQQIIFGFKDHEAYSISIPWEIYLDGKSIKRKIKSLSVVYDENQIHNTISISSTSIDLQFDADPEDRKGESRIELQIGNRVLYFLLEDRKGDKYSFQLWGRSLSALDDLPYSSETDFVLDTATLASEVAGGVLTANALDWECSDWVIPDVFEVRGTPIQIIKKIAQIIGAVVRSQDDGSILVRDRFPVRPVDIMADTSPVAWYTDIENLIGLNYQVIKGKGFDSVEVNGGNDYLIFPTLEIEESNRPQGDSVHVRAYWETVRTPEEALNYYATQGNVTFLGNFDEEKEEFVVFQSGKGSTAKPIQSIISIEWIGMTGGSVGYAENNKELIIGGNASRIAKIKYVTNYDRYLVAEHDIEKLLYVLAISGGENVSVLVQTGEGVKEAPSIQDINIVTESVAVIRGKAYLDNSKYDIKKLSIVAPYKNEAVDGKLISLDDAGLKIYGNVHLEKVTISIQGLKVLNNMEVKQCLV